MNEKKNMEDRRSYKRAKPNGKTKLEKLIESNGYDKKVKVEWRSSENSDSGQWKEAILVDLSIAGAGIAMEHKLENGTPVSLRFTALNIPEDDIRLPSTAKGETRNSSKINDTIWRHGIKFEKLHFAFAQWIDQD